MALSVRLRKRRALRPAFTVWERNLLIGDFPWPDLMGEPISMQLAPDEITRVDREGRSIGVIRKTQQILAWI
jgi:hypothetical protein